MVFKKWQEKKYAKIWKKNSLKTIHIIENIFSISPFVHKEYHAFTNASENVRRV